MPRPVGRPTKCTKELQERIVALIVRGDYVETAVALVGLSKQAFHEWCARGRAQKRGRYREFADAIEFARAAADHHDMGQVNAAAAAGILGAATWKLERRRPELFGRASFGGTPDPDQPTVNPEDYDVIAAAVAGKILDLVEEISPDVAAQVRERLGRKADSAAAPAAEPGAQVS